ncbi:hypothetical protein KAR91_48075, partial [Candidatus Pacearchaeota archaeon]|nr:hypothetical protein [Candidatus Pacearchaeota archaeon]
STVNNSLTWTVTRYPLNSSEAFNLNTQRFLINANIEGGNLILGTVPVSAYAEIVNAGLSMTINEGSKPAEIPCSATNPSTGLTCSAGNEGLGVVIPNLPYAGRFEVCAAFGHQINLDSTDTLVSYFQWIETPNDAQTVLQTGKVRQPSGINNVSTAGLQREDTLPVSICGEFEFNSAGKKTLRLMYTQETAGTPVSSVILADGASGSQGDRDFHVTVKSLTQGFPLPFIFNTVTTSNQNGESIHTAKISQGAGTCAVDSQRGTWISSISTFGAGFCDLTVDAAICDINVTSCQATCQSADNTPSLNVTGGKIRVGCDTGAAGQNSIRHVNCMCKKQ